MGVYLKIDKRSEGLPFAKLLLPKIKYSILFFLYSVILSLC